MNQNVPLLTIDKFGLADTVRADKNRLPGMCSRLINTAPNLSGRGERIRRGYSAYTDVTAPTGMEILKVAKIHSPTQEDVHIWFASSGGQKIYMNPWWDSAGVRQTTNLRIDETIATFVWAGSVGLNSIVITGSDALLFQTTANYYKNWLVKNTDQTEYAIVTASSYSAAAGGTTTLTVQQAVDATGINWATGEHLALVRNFHDNFGFAATYNNTLTDPPVVVADNNIIRLSGGQSSAVGNVGIHITPRMNRTFFPGATTPFTFLGTYISERRLRAVPLADILNSDVTAYDAGPGAPVGLEVGKTYWLAFAPIYDGFQIGELTEVPSSSFTGIIGAEWDENYLHAASVATTACLGLGFDIPIMKYNKRITGLALYAAQDDGDTRTDGRQSPLFFISLVDFLSSGGMSATFQLGDYNYSTSGTLLVLTGTTWNARGNAYVIDAGYVESPSDTMYAYSQEAISGFRHYISNLYVASEAVIDRQNLYTNPIGGNANINAGVIQPDVFSNEEAFYVLRVQPTIGTRITGIEVTAVQELLILKDRGTLIAREYLNPAGYASFNWQVVSHERGCVTLNQLVPADDGWIYFGGYDDIHRYRQNVLENLIEDSQTQNDWLNTYREGITRTSKESTVVWLLPERVVYFDIGQTSGQQYAFYPEYGWRQVRFKEVATVATQFFKWMSRLQSGAVLGVTTDATPAVMKFSTPSSAAYYYSDNGTAIPYLIDTGDFIPSQQLAIDTLLNYFALSRTFDSPMTGTLDIVLYLNGVVLRTYAGQNNALAMLRVQSMVADKRIANSYRLVINNNAAPETLNVGSIFTLNAILLFGRFQARGKYAVETVSGNVIGVFMNTIAGKMEVLVNTTDTVCSWDLPFVKTYTSSEGGAGTPSYRFEFEPPSVLDSDHSTVETVTIVSKTLTTITLRSSADSTLVRFSATE